MTSLRLLYRNRLRFLICAFEPDVAIRNRIVYSSPNHHRDMTEIKQETSS